MISNRAREALDEYDKGESQVKILHLLLELEADSQMLDDLIEMLWEFKDWGFLYNEFHREKTPWLIRNLDQDKSWSAGSTPREAMSAAIKEWKKK